MNRTYAGPLIFLALAVLSVAGMGTALALKNLQYRIAVLETKAAALEEGWRRGHNMRGHDNVVPPLPEGWFDK
jgi:hypothetical protein